jgi:hypothetical protein
MSTEISATGFQKVTVTLPKQLVERLNEIIPQRQRSRFIAEAIQEQLITLEQSIAIEEAAGLWKDEDYPHLRTEADIDRWLAELRGTWRLPTIENE